MRRATATFALLVALTVVLMVLGALVKQPLLFLVAGLAFFAAAVAGIALLPWRRIVRVPAMEGLFVRPRPGQRWCSRCGKPGPPTCPDCGPRRTRGRAQGARSKT